MTQSQQGLKFSQIFSSARARIVVWYIAIMSLCTGGSILAIRQALFARLEERDQRSLVQEFREFQTIITSLNLRTYSSPKAAAAAIFDKYLSRNIPNDDEFLITFLDGTFYQSSPLALPESLHPSSALMQRWAQLSQPQRGKQDHKTGTILYLAEPVEIDGGTRGVFVIARSISGEYGEVDEAVLVVGVVNHKARLWVRDMGVGIAPLDQQRIFERFARASRSRRRSDGAGLGLAIVKAIAEAHGGRVELLSRPGVGSTFTLVIPVQPA